jgi:hypothetical protein
MRVPMNIKVRFLFGALCALVAVPSFATIFVNFNQSPQNAPIGGEYEFSVELGTGERGDVTFTQTIPPGMTFDHLYYTFQWSCTTPPVGSGGSVTCTINNWEGVDRFTLHLRVASGANGDVVSSTATGTENVGSTFTSVNGSTITSTATKSVILFIPAVLHNTITGPAAMIGTYPADFVLRVANNGAAAAASPKLTISLPLNSDVDLWVQTDGADFYCFGPTTTDATIRCEGPLIVSGGAAEFRLRLHRRTPVTEYEHDYGYVGILATSANSDPDSSFLKFSLVRAPARRRGTGH